MERNVSKVNSPDLMNGSLQVLKETSRRVLLVDDEPVTWRLINRFLGTKWIVDGANDAKEATAVFTGREYYAVIVDYHMPGYDGVWFLNWVKKVSPNTLRILYSACDREQIAKHVRSGLIQCFIGKPASIDAFFSGLEKK